MILLHNIIKLTDELNVLTHGSIWEQLVIDLVNFMYAFYKLIGK